MCQSHMEAPAVAGTMVWAETREEIGVQRRGRYRFRFGKKKKKTEAGTGSGICNGVVVGSRTWKEPLQDWSWMWSLCCGRRQSYSSSEERVRMETNI